MKLMSVFALGILLFSSCVVPLNTSYESARMLKKGEFELMGNYTHYSFSDEGESDAVNNNIGGRIGYGISEKFNLKARYEHLIPTEDEASGVHYIDLAPKVQLVPRMLAATMPVGLYFAEDETEFVISPKVMFTYPANDYFEATLAAKADIFPEDEADVYLGLNVGLGLSNNLNRWALRPEFGLMFDPGESGVALAGGIGFNVILSPRNQQTSR